MYNTMGILTIKACEEDLAHLLWLVEEEISRGMAENRDIGYWGELLNRLKQGIYVTTCY